MRGDYVALEVAREVVEDGQGGETEGIVIRIWSEDDDWQDARGTLLAVELRIPGHEPPIALPMVRETIDHVLSTLELE